MFTKLTTANTAYALTAGQRVKGSASGAKGTIAVSSANSATTVYLMDVEGTFSTSDTIRLEHSTSGGKAVSAVKQYSTDDVRSLFQECRSSSGTADFTADTLLTDNQFSLSGALFSVGSSDKTVQGVNTTFTQQLKPGDVLRGQGGVVAGIVDTITSDIELELVANVAGHPQVGKWVRQRARLQEQEKTVAISPTPKDFVSSMTPNQVTVRKQTVLTLAGATVTLGSGSGMTFVAEDANDYVTSIHDGNTDSDNEGAIINTQEGSTLTISNNTSLIVTHAQSTPLDADDVLKVVYAVQKDVSGGYC